MRTEGRIKSLFENKGRIKSLFEDKGRIKSLFEDKGRIKSLFEDKGRIKSLFEDNPGLQSGGYKACNNAIPTVSTVFPDMEKLYYTLPSRFSSSRPVGAL